MRLIDKNIFRLDGSKKALALSGICACFLALTSAGQAVCLGKAVVMLWVGSSLSQAAALILGFLVFLVLRLILTQARRAYMQDFAARISTDLRRKQTEHLFDLGPSSVRKRGTGAVVASLVEDTDKVETYVAFLIPKLCDLFLIPLILIAVLFVLDWISALIALIVFPATVAYMVLLGSNAKEVSKRQQGVYRLLSNHFTDTLRGLVTLTYLGRSSEQADHIYAVSDRFRRATVDTLRVATLSSLLLDFFGTFALAAVSIMVGFRLLVGSIDFFRALCALVLVPDYFAPLRRFSQDFHATLDGQNALADILDFLDTQDKEASRSEVRSQARASGIQGEPELTRWNPTSRLTLNNIAYSYDHAETAALVDVHLSVQGYAKIGLIGESGSGKSTLTHILAGFISPSQGSISLEGCNLDSLCLESWHDQLTYIPQNPYIFHASLRDNVAWYVPGAPEARIRQAIELVGLNELVSELPDTLDTVIGEGGRQLSAGQAQRVALARAFLDEKRRVWIFDEPTAHLDIETELELKERMLFLMQDRLVFFATHRLHWMKDMDFVAVLEGGTIVEFASGDGRTQNRNEAYMQQAHGQGKELLS